MNPNITQLIDQYLNGELSEQDVLEFEKRLKKNPAFQQEVELQRSIQEAASRAWMRTEVKKAGRNYHANKILKWAGFSTAVIAITASALWLVVNSADGALSESNEITSELKAQLDCQELIDGLPMQYFKISDKGGVVLSDKGILLSVPKEAFLLNGKPYTGEVALQFQEAVNAADIIKGGLSTMSGDRMLETQGMISLQGYTTSGQKLEFNPKVGVYVQVPTDELKENMMLFDGVKKADGTIDWQNPEKLEKIPVPVDMSELDFYPEDYEPYLDHVKWKKDKASRDGLYLSFEPNNSICSDQRERPQGIISFTPHRFPTREEYSHLGHPYSDAINNFLTPAEFVELSKWKEGPNWERDFSQIKRIIEYTDKYVSVEYLYFYDTSYYYLNKTELDSAASIEFIYPAKVLGFWNKKFNNTNLATREFEKRMQSIHKTCNNTVLDKYIKQLDKPISEIDRQVVAMGYTEFLIYAEENVGALNPDNPHVKGLQEFYEKGIEALRKKAQDDHDKELKRQNKWDEGMAKERKEEQKRTQQRNATNLEQEFRFNLDNVYKQLGYTKGFTIRRGSGISRNSAIKNIDAYVMEATVNRTTTVIKDPFSAKTAKITYNDFSLEVPDASKYVKLYAYLFPHQLNSYQRIDHKNGKFDYPLNDDIIYDIAVIGITENGFEYFQKQTFNKGAFGTITLEKVSEAKFEASLNQLNGKRIKKPMRIKEELDWLIKEREDYKEQKMRQEMWVFRENVAKTLSECYPSSFSAVEESDFGL